MSEVDAELVAKTEAARRANRVVVIHRLDGSKTGQSAPSLDCLAELCAKWPKQILVLADCCQLRSTPDHIKALLTRGFIITLTGSKFAGGPSFCGALLLTPAIVAKLRMQRMPAGLSAYSAQLDWPAVLRASTASAALPAANIGLALRWHAALAEIVRFFARPVALRDELLERFHQAAIAEAAHMREVILLPTAAADDSFGDTIVTFVLRRADGSLLDAEAAAVLQRRLRSDGFHLGQPVEIGGAGALRLCASMALINRLADKVATGTTPAAAIAPAHAAIAALFHRLGERLCA
jgi:hypothetical protein